jgi:hypothetical protein
MRQTHLSKVTTILPWLVLGVIEAGAVSVFWAFDALPFMDLPAHEGLFALRHGFNAAGFEGRFFLFAPHLGPYSLFNGLGEAITAWLGADKAVRLLATLPTIALPLAMFWARKRLIGSSSPFFGFIAVILSFGYMTLAGFASYLLSVAILLVAFTEWLVLIGSDNTHRAALGKFIPVTLLALLVFIAHGFTFILLLLMASLSVLVAARFRTLVQMTVFVPATIVAAYSAYVERVGDQARYVAKVDFTLVFQGIADKFSLLVTPTLMTRTGIDALIGVLLWLVIVFCGVATHRLLEHSNSSIAKDRKLSIRVLIWVALALFLLFLVLPHSVAWFGFVDARLLPLVLLLGLVAIDESILQSALGRAIRIGAGVAAAVVVVLVLTASYLFQAEAAGYRETLARIPAHSRLLNLPINPDSAIFTSHPFVHYDKLVLVQRPIVVSDIWFHQGSAIYPTGINPSLRLPPEYSSSNLGRIVWEHYRLEDWDYILIRTLPEAATPQTPPSLELIEHVGGWWLFKNPSAKVLPERDGGESVSK